jgi:hypothetical protein
MKNTLPILISILLSISFAKAYGPKDKDIELSNLIGKRIFQAPLIEWLEKNSYKTAIEEIRTDGPEFIIKHYEKGYLMKYDINMVLNTITLYKGGSSYKMYKGRLPLNLKFGMNRDSLYKVIDLRFEEVEDNPYVLTRSWNNNRLELYFSSKGLNQINILANDTLPTADDMGYVRLVPNGTIVSGDCDSISGKMTWDNETAMYEGEWKNSMPHGRGYFIDQNNNWYKGEFRYGYFWGKGQLSVADYYLYEGGFLMSRRHGTGNCKFRVPKGETYEGQWKEDQMNGLGKYSTNATVYYYGNMENDKFNGKGKLVTNEGWMEGTFKEGLPNGNIKQYIKLENTMIEGSWVDGKREGKFKLTNTETKKETFKLFQNDIEIIDK